MQIRSAADLEPKSEGFANRATESINIIAGVVETFFNGLGGAIQDVTGQLHGSHLNINSPGEPANPQERMRRREVEFAEAPGNPRDQFVSGHPELTRVPITQGSVRVQKFIDNDNANFFV